MTILSIIGGPSRPPSLGPSPREPPPRHAFLARVLSRFGGPSPSLGPAWSCAFYVIPLPERPELPESLEPPPLSPLPSARRRAPRKVQNVPKAYDTLLWSRCCTARGGRPSRRAATSCSA